MKSISTVLKRVMLIVSFMMPAVALSPTLVTSKVWRCRWTGWLSPLLLVIVRRQRQRVDLARGGRRVAVERNHHEAMARERQRDILGRAGIEQAEQHALAFAHADGLAVAEHLVVERGRRVEYLEAIVRRRTLA